MYEIGVGTAYRYALKELKALPHCADLTRKYCNRFCGILVVDGKYVKVKGYDRKIPVFYGIDYLTHDIPTYILSVAENYQTCISFFQSLRLLNYPLSAVVSDDNLNIYQAAQKVYPSVTIQLCHNHYKQTIRTSLDVTHDPTYVPFMRDIETLFENRRSKEELIIRGRKLFHRYGHNDRCVSVLTDIQRRFDLLTGYTKAKRIPRTTNLIECFNSHLEGRLKTIKGFNSFMHADDWLNAYFIKRRLKPFTDCSGRFRSLNGTCSLEQTRKSYYQIDALLRLFK